MNKKDNITLVNRKELKDLNISDFKESDCIICNGYYIHVKYGEYSRASMLTTVTTRYDLRDLKMSKHPQYIRNFIDGN